MLWRFRIMFVSFIIIPCLCAAQTSLIENPDTEDNYGYLLLEKRDQVFFNGAWTDNYKTVYEYDSRGHRIQKTRFDIAHFSQEINESRSIYTCDSLGRIIRQMDGKWRDSAWSDNRLYVSVYMNDGSAIEKTAQTRRDTGWLNSIRSVREFDTHGNMLECRTWEWDSQENDWVNFRLETFEYGTNNLRLARLTRQYVEGAGFKDSQRLEYVYNSDNRLLEKRYQMPDGDVWTTISGVSYDYHFNKDSSIASRVDIYFSADTAENTRMPRYVHSYNENGLLAETQLLEYSDGQWSKVFRYLYSYSDYPLSDNYEAPSAVKAMTLMNHPNPFNPRTFIRFCLPNKAFSTLNIYNATGRLVRVLLQASAMERGTHSVLWDGLDAVGQTASSGTYFCVLKAGDRSLIRPIFFLR